MYSNWESCTTVLFIYSTVTVCPVTVGRRTEELMDCIGNVAERTCKYVRYTVSERACTSRIPICTATYFCARYAPQFSTSFFVCPFAVQTVQSKEESVQRLGRNVHVCRYWAWQDLVTHVCRQCANSVARYISTYMISLLRCHTCITIDAEEPHVCLH